jgi:hypothetical protein
LPDLPVRVHSSTDLNAFTAYGPYYPGEDGFLDVQIPAAANRQFIVLELLEN